MNNDYIIVRRQPDANNGEIVVAMIEDEATVKRFYRECGHIRLQPENDAMSPIIVPSVTILGKVVAWFAGFKNQRCLNTKKQIRRIHHFLLICFISIIGMALYSL